MGGSELLVVSAPLITTLVDGTGLIIYFTIARLFLQLDQQGTHFRPSSVPTVQLSLLRCSARLRANQTVAW